jgi:hypothetical protein
MNLTLEIPDDRAARYRKQAQARGLTVDRWLLELADTAAAPVDVSPPAAPGEPATGMVEENGLLVYRTGNPLPVQVVDDAIRRSREERFLHLLGNLS